MVPAPDKSEAVMLLPRKNSWNEDGAQDAVRRRLRYAGGRFGRALSASRTDAFPQRRAAAKRAQILEVLLTTVIMTSLGCRRRPAPAPSPTSSTMAPLPSGFAKPDGSLLVGEAAMGDFTADAPGVRRKLTAADLRPPNETKSADNGANLVDRPEGAWPRVPEGLEVE
jgi:hypothetical protein